MELLIRSLIINKKKTFFLSSISVNGKKFNNFSFDLKEKTNKLNDMLINSLNFNELNLLLKNHEPLFSIYLEDNSELIFQSHFNNLIEKSTPLNFIKETMLFNLKKNIRKKTS